MALMGQAERGIVAIDVSHLNQQVPAAGFLEEALQGRQVGPRRLVDLQMLVGHDHPVGVAQGLQRIGLDAHHPNPVVPQDLLDAGPGNAFPAGTLLGPGAQLGIRLRHGQHFVVGGLAKRPQVAHGVGMGGADDGGPDGVGRRRRRGPRLQGRHARRRGRVSEELTSSDGSHSVVSRSR